MSEEGIAAVRITARGHPNIRATHSKTVEFTTDETITSAGTCIVGVACEADEAALARLRGPVRVTLRCGDAADILTARVSPFYRPGDPLIIRRSGEAGPRTFCVGASKGASGLDRALVAALAQPGAELEVLVEPLATDHPEAGVLFVVGMPIGNEADLSPRALDVLAGVDLVAAEDTRTLRAFLDRFGLRCEAMSFHDHNERGRTPEILARLERGDRVALVSEAGMPIVSDPGFTLVRAAHEAGVLVSVVPGPDAVTAALAVSGIAPDDFRFIGFLPRKAGARHALLEPLVAAPYTIVFYEAPHRILETLAEIDALFGDRELAVCRNLTKFGEEVMRGSAVEVRARFEAMEKPRGEMAVVIAGAPPEPAGSDAPSISPELETMVRSLVRDGLPTKAVAGALAAASGLSRRDAYDVVIALK